MNVILLGVGMQGKAALHDLASSHLVSQITAVDYDLDGLQAHVASQQYGRKVQCAFVDAADPESLNQLLKQQPDVIINLLPTQFVNTIAAAAIEHGVHMVSTSYATPELRAMADQAAAKGITILPEFGLDPGIDLVLLGEAVRALDRVDEIFCYGAGVPEPAAANNPIKYKISWTFAGVLASYRRPGRILQQGQVVEIGDAEMFDPALGHLVDMAGLGKLEAYPNGDAIHYVKALGLENSGLQTMGRYTMRWPGHSAFWKTLVDLHLLDDEPVMVETAVAKPTQVAISPKKFLAAALSPHLQYAADERDVVIVRIEVKGRQNGTEKHLIYQMIDKRNLDTGFMAMNRTVGFTASIGAIMIGTGQLTKRGILSPIHDIPYKPFVQELAKRNIHITVDSIA